MPFKAIKGQDAAISIIRECLLQARLAGSYLFTGPQGIGKKLAALNLAKAVNCLNGDFDACGSCVPCLKIEQGIHPDVRVVVPEDSEAIKIEQIRQIQKEASLKAYEGKKKVTIIDNAHNLTADAANALLKTLEEPAQNSMLILISDKPNLLFKTIVSRCQIVKFRPFPRQELQSILEQDYGLGKEPAHFLAYFCEGSLGEALRLKATDLWDKKNRVIDGFLFYKRRSYYAAVEDRAELKRQLNILAGALRDIYIIKAGARDLGLINADRSEELSGLSGRYTFGDLSRALDSLSEALLCSERNINVKLLLSNLRAELCMDKS